MDSLSHISFSVSDLQKSIVFYDAILAELGHKRVYTGSTSAGWGPSEDKEIFAIKKRVDQITPPSPGFHLAFHAQTRQQVQGFYEKALQHGGQDNGSPGPRPEYSDHYYAAFVIDPDGYQLEAKLHV